MTIRVLAKGDHWGGFPKDVKRAKAEIEQDKQKGNYLSRHDTKKAIVSKTVHDLLEAFMEALKNGDLFNVFSNAGRRMERVDQAGARYNKTLRTYLACDTDSEGYYREMHDLAADELALSLIHI